MNFKPIAFKDDPLWGAGGYSWFQRAPRSLQPDEWERLDKALKAGVISVDEYTDWKANVS